MSKINFNKIPYELKEYYILYFYFKNDYSYYEHLKKNEYEIFSLFNLDRLYKDNVIFINNSFLSFIGLNEKSFFKDFNKKIKFGKIHYSCVLTHDIFEDIVYKIGKNISSVDILHNEYSCLIAHYLPHLIDYNLYNWQNDSDCFFEYCQEYFDADKFDWEKYSLQLIKYAPNLFDAARFNWGDIKALKYLVNNMPYLFKPKYFNWDKYSHLFIIVTYPNEDTLLFEKYKNNINWNNPNVIKLIRNNDTYNNLIKYIE